MAQAPAGPRGPTPKTRRAVNSGGKPRGPKIAHGLARLANQQIHAAEQPVLHQIAQERAANLAKAQAQMGFAKAAAAIMQQAAPNVQAGYANAANSSAGYAKGLGDLVQAPLDQNASDQAAFLAKMGTPQGAIQGAAPVGTLSYGTQGLIPATSLQREGAAWGAAAQLAPGNMLHQGQQAAAGILGNDPSLTSLQSQLAQIAATRPDVYRQLVAAAQAQRAQQIAAGQAQQRIGISQQNANLRAQEIQAQNYYHQASLQLEQERIALARRKDAKAVANAIQKGHRPDASLSRVYGYIVDSNGNAILNHGRRIKVKTSSGSSSGGLPPWGKVNPNGASLQGGPSPGSLGIFNAGNYAGVDQGVDYSGAGHIPALGHGVVTDRGVTHIRQGYTVPYIVYKLTSGPHEGRYVYVVENFRPSVRVGQTIRPGQSIGFAKGTFPYIETGFNQTAKGWTAYGDLDGPQSQGYVMQQYINALIREWGREA
jgi:hypothetical protein